MSNNKQSSVEWFWLNLNDDLIGDLSPEKISKIYELKQQAKAMHKEEIETAFDKGADIGYDVGSNHDWHEGHNRGYQYYNETYGGDK